MHRFSGLMAFAGTLLLSVMAVQAGTVVIGVGSSAIFSTMGVGSWSSLAGAGASHYTVGGECAGGSCAFIDDTRSSSIRTQSGRLWVVWSADHSNIWAYLATDSVSGIRAFFAVPRARLRIDPSVTTTVHGQDLILSAFWCSDAPTLPQDVYAALDMATFTAAFSDLRPEDAKVAQARSCAPLNTANYDGLGYCVTANSVIGDPVRSSYSLAQSPIVAFNLSGADPFTGFPIPAYTTIDLGASPMVFFYNRSGPLANLATHDLSSTAVQELFTTGEGCDTATLGVAGVNQGIIVVQGEPLSGAWGTAEASNFRLTANGFTHSQEVNVNPTLTSGNPLNLPCGKGLRKRALGTFEMLNAVQKTPASVGYFLGVTSAACPIAYNPQIRYFTVNGVDPFLAAYGGGEIECGVLPHPHTRPNVFTNLRNGTYPSWALLNAVTDASGANFENTKALVSATQNTVDCTTQDFVPAVGVSNDLPGCSAGPDPGLSIYHSHYSNPLFPERPNNGLSGQIEAGSDAGGCIERTGPAPGVLGCRQ